MSKGIVQDRKEFLQGLARAENAYRMAEIHLQTGEKGLQGRRALGTTRGSSDVGSMWVQ